MSLVQIPSPNSWEQLSPDERESFGQHMIEALLDRYEAATRRLDEWSPDSTSRLAQDNAASKLYRPMTHELFYLLSSARDHLNEVHRAFRVTAHAPAFALFTLIRSAIESCAYGIWLQNGGTLNKRVGRLIQMQWDQRVSVDKYTAASGVVDPTVNTALLEQVLSKTKAARPGIQGDFRRSMPTTTNVLIETDKFIGAALLNSGLNAWRACSGITHGNVHFSTGVMNTAPIPGGGQGGATEVNTPSLAGVSLMLLPAIIYFETLIDLIFEHGQPMAGHPNYY